MGKPKAKIKVDKDLCRLITPEGRVSYPHLFKPQAPKPTDKPKYSITLLFPKDKELKGLSPQGKPRSLERIIKMAKIQTYGENEANWPDDMLNPIKDGDSKKLRDKEGYKGHWVVKAISNEDSKPAVVGPDMKPIENPNDLYPGCYARANIFAYCWEYMGKEGVGFILDHVQKLRDGKSFSGKKPVDQVFQPVEIEDEDSSDDDDSDEENF